MYAVFSGTCKKKKKKLSYTVTTLNYGTSHWGRLSAIIHYTTTKKKEKPPRF